MAQPQARPYELILLDAVQGSLILDYGPPGASDARARRSPREEAFAVRALLIGVALAFLGLFLIVPLAAVFHEAGLAARGHLRRWHAMLYHTEVTHAYGRTVCEAQQAGCVPVVDRRGGFVEQIDSGRTGYLCETVDDFAAALGELREAERRRRLTLAARQAGGRRGSLALWRRRFLQLCRETV